MKATEKKEICVRVAFLLGCDIVHLSRMYEEECSETLNMLQSNNAALIVRTLSKLRNSLFKHFGEIDRMLRTTVTNLDRMKWFNKEDFDFLRENNIHIIKANGDSDGYMKTISLALCNAIGNCASLFPEWVNWAYIKEMFIVPNWSKDGTMKREYAKFSENFNYYPWNLFFYWRFPKDCGNLLDGDIKFLKTIYESHGEEFTNAHKCTDAHAILKSDIYDFINSTPSVEIAVDCENADVYKLVATLSSLEEEEVAKIKKISLYDDVNANDAWDKLSKYTNIPINHVEVKRVKETKSVVDIKMASSITQAYYRDGVKSFIIFSSDSDYSALMSTIPDAKFMVAYEKSKCSQTFLDSLAENGIRYCCIDDFGGNGVEKMKKDVLIDALRDMLPSFENLNGHVLARKAYNSAHIDASDKEMECFYTKYIKSLRISVSDNGDLTLVLEA